jgi:hypothetical protein
MLLLEEVIKEVLLCRNHPHRNPVFSLGWEALEEEVIGLMLGERTLNLV